MLRRTTALLLVGWYLAIGAGLPMVDALWFHHEDNSHQVHVEDVGNDCHRQECPLESPAAPQAPATAAEFARIGRLPTEALAVAPQYRFTSQESDGASRARAPPRFI